MKLFFLSPHGSSEPLSVDHLHNAIQQLETALSVTSGNLKIDHFILAIPNQTFDENDLDSSEIDQFTEDVQTLYLPIWKRLSELQQTGRIGRLGVSEFSKQQLEILKAAAVQVGAAVPQINQVNLQDCCVLPKGLIDYAKAEGIELFTHGDSSGKELKKICFCVFFWGERLGKEKNAVQNEKQCMQLQKNVVFLYAHVGFFLWHRKHTSLRINSDPSPSLFSMYDPYY